MFSEDQTQLDIKRRKSKDSSKKHCEKYKASQEAQTADKAPRVGGFVFK